LDFDIDDWMEFLGYVISEGGFNNSRDDASILCIAQKDKAHVSKIEACLSRMGLSYGKYYYKKKDADYFTITGKTLIEHLKSTVGTVCDTKTIPNYVFSLPYSKLKILYDALMLGDGSFDKRGFTNGSYSTTSPYLVDDFQRLVTLLGIKSSVNVQDNSRGFGGTNSKVLYIISVSWNGNDTFIKQDTNISKVMYSGKVFCFEVPNHLFVTRRRDLVAIHGNTAIVADDPPLRHLGYQQFEHECIIRELVDFQIDQAILHGAIPPLDEDERQFDVVQPDISVSDNQVFGTALKLVAEGMRLAMDDGLCDIDTAREVFFKIMGVPIPEDIEQLITKQQNDKMKQTYVAPKTGVSRFVDAKPTVRKDKLP